MTGKHQTILQMVPNTTSRHLLRSWRNASVPTHNLCRFCISVPILQVSKRFQVSS